VPKGSKSGRASLKTRKGRASSKPREGLVQGIRVVLSMDKPPRGAGKTEVFSPSGGKFIKCFNLSGVFNLVNVLIYQIF
jgi:hypothetical protein